MEYLSLEYRTPKQSAWVNESAAYPIDPIAGHTLPLIEPNVITYSLYQSKNTTYYTTYTYWFYYVIAFLLCLAVEAKAQQLSALPSSTQTLILAEGTNNNEAQSHQQQLETKTSLQAASSATMNAQEVKAIGKNAINNALYQNASSIPAVAAQAFANINMQSLVTEGNGTAIERTFTLGGTTNYNGTSSLYDSKAVKVSIQYEPRPIGGIIVAEVKVLPVFTGVGTMARPTIKKTYIEAINDVQQEELKAIIDRLSNEIVAEIMQD